MTPAERAALRVLCDEATPAEAWTSHAQAYWEEGEEVGYRASAPVHGHDGSDEVADSALEYATRDAHFIAAARTAVPALLDECEELERDRDHAREMQDVANAEWDYTARTANTRIAELEAENARLLDLLRCCESGAKSRFPQCPICEEKRYPDDPRQPHLDDCGLAAAISSAKEPKP